jgi:ABC-type transport system substrate-binding protein
MTTQPTTQLYRLAKDGAEEKYQQADALIEAGAHYQEIAELQYCAFILNEFSREIYNDPAMWSDQPHDPTTRESMEERSNIISAALKGDDLSSNERAELWAELAEIYDWLLKDENQLSDYADARICARFQDPL